MARDDECPTTLTRHEALLDLEGPVSHRASRVAFSAPFIGSPRVEISVNRWLDMDCPPQVKVTIEPVGSGARRPTFNPRALG